MIDLAAFDSQTGILMVGHGSRQPEGNEALIELCRSMELRLGITPVQPCYLELARPSIDEGLASLYRRGVERVIVLPLQLTAGRHVRYDIPCEVGRSLAKLSNMFVSFADHLGAHPAISDIADSRLQEAMNGRAGNTTTEYLLVARGSRDPLVRGGILRWAENRRMTLGGPFKPCFLAMNQPIFEDGLKDALAKNPERIVVQPYLLYAGRLLQRIQTTVSNMALKNPRIDWVVAGPLGPDDRLLDFALELAVDAKHRDFHRESHLLPVKRA